MLVLGDIHGRTIWKDIIEKENPDKVIFLGDYVSTHEDISEDQQISNLEEILSYKENNSDKVILLRGNHCLEALGYYWAECSGHCPKVSQYMQSIKDRFLNLTQWIHLEGNTIFSHAGISATWLLDSVEPYIIREFGSQYDDNTSDIEVILSLINSIEPNELFGFSPDSYFDRYGDSVTQPCTWIRPQALCTCNLLGYDQVVGHTPVKQITNIYKSTKGNRNIWLCDNLQDKQYLIIDDNVFTPKYLNDEA